MKQLKPICPEYRTTCICGTVYTPGHYDHVITAWQFSLTILSLQIGVWYKSHHEIVRKTVVL